MTNNDNESVIGLPDGRQVPRYAGPDTFARLPRLADLGGRTVAVAVAGIPFDSGVSYRPGARFGPHAVRQASKMLRPYHPGLDTHPFDVHQVADAGDMPVNPFNIPEAIDTIEREAPAPCLARLTGCWPSAGITPSHCRCCARPRRSTVRSPLSTSTRTWIPGIPTSALRSRTARLSAGRSRRACSHWTRARTWASAARCTRTPT